MKKIVFLASFLLFGYASASTLAEKEISAEKVESISELVTVKLAPPGIRHGLAVMDTNEGSCIVYGTIVTDSNGDSHFFPGSQATNASMGLPSCYGSGNYLA